MGEELGVNFVRTKPVFVHAPGIGNQCRLAFFVFAHSGDYFQERFRGGGGTRFR